MDMYAKEFWFVVGSQFLYGPEVVEQERVPALQGGL